MSGIIAYTEGLADLLNDELVTRSALINKARATNNIRQASGPGILVSPAARRDEFTLDGGYQATVSVYCIAAGALGDLTDAKVLDELADVVLEVIPAVSLVEPVALQVPTHEAPKAALRCEFTVEVTP